MKSQAFIVDFESSAPMTASMLFGLTAAKELPRPQKSLISLLKSRG